MDGLAEAGEQEEVLGAVEVAEDEYDGEPQGDVVEVEDDNVVPEEVGSFDIDMLGLLDLRLNRNILSVLLLHGLYWIL